METRHVLSSKGQTPSYCWLPIRYLLLFGGVFLISPWAEVNRKQQFSEALTACTCVGAKHLSATATGCNPVRSAPKTERLEGVEKPVFSPCDLIPVENLKSYG